MSFLVQPLWASLRVTVATLLVCVAGYSLVVLGLAQLRRDTAQGSLIRAADGHVVGSRLVAQSFTRPEYFWPRPSAAGPDGYDAAKGSGSNKSPTSPDLTKRAAALVARYGATAERPLPAELAAASGSGLDPHITLRAALYQADRVARARRVPAAQVEALVRALAFEPGGSLTPERLVNVLALNLALDAGGAAEPPSAAPKGGVISGPPS
jgi:K+-transporting ATPase ATPase C chain